MIFEDANMSNVIPPMLSSSPPPVDIRDDDDEEEDEFSNFRVADLALNLSDVITGDDDSDKWKSPVLEEPSIPLPQSPAHEKFSVPFEMPQDVLDTVNIVVDVESPKTETLLNGESCRDDHEKVDNQKEFEEPVEGPTTLEADDETGSEEEIANIPFPPVYSPCVTPPENELRTSPEGADSEDVCGDESPEFRWNVSFPDDCDLKSTVKDNSESTFDDVDKTINSECPDESKQDDFGDFSNFADFSSQPFPIENTPFPEAVPVSKEPIVVTTLNDDDDFDEFESAAPSSEKEGIGFQMDDHIPTTNDIESNYDDEFDDFESAAPLDDGSQLEGVNVTDKVADFFPYTPLEAVEDPALTNCLNSCLDDSSSVWGYLKDLDASHALKLQWSSSTASNKLLSSLNIDSRNILIGSRWSGSVPRFAANLSCAPLEPVKAEATTRQHVPIVTRLHSTVVEDVVPAAQFDWNGSGLTNPLDCSEKNENAAGSPLELITDSRPPQLPQNDMWSSPDLPSTDVLLPSPVVPHQIHLDTMLLQQLTGDSQTPGVDVELQMTSEPSWSTDNGISEQVKEESDNLWNVAGNSSSWTISSQMEQKGSDSMSKTPLSAEACRIVDTLPDLSFLSARKLLYAANENLGRFQSRSQL